MRIRTNGTCWITAVALMFVSLAALAQNASILDRSARFSIPPQSLASALMDFSDQSGVQVATAGAEISKVKSQGVSGTRPLGEALNLLLNGTGLKFRAIGNTIAIHKREMSNTEVSHAADSVTQELRLATGDKSLQEGQETKDTSSSEQDDEGNGSSKDISEIEVFAKPTRNVDMKRSNNDALPYQVIKREDIERAGYQNITQFARSLPSNTTTTNAEAGASLGNNQGGKVEINLRGLGVSNTLILVNGRRMAASTAYSPQGDISLIPLSAVDQVEMLSSGASAIYGASAVGGVVNLILRKEYTGAEMDVSYGNVFDTDAANRRLSFVTGFNSPERMHNVTFYGDVSDQNPLRAGDRDYADLLRKRTLAIRPSLIYGAATPPVAGRANFRSVSGTPLGIPGNPSAIYASVPQGYNGTGGLAAFNSTAGLYQLDTDSAGAGGGRTNLVDDTESAALGLNTYHRFTPMFSAFTELSYSYRRQRAYRAQNTTLVVPASNAFNPFGQAVTVSGVFDDLGEPKSQTRFDDYRGVAGVEGKLGSGWRYVTDVTYERSALPADVLHTTFGTLVFPQALSSSNPAVAYNPFLDFDSGARNSQAAIDLLSTNVHTRYKQSLRQGAARFFNESSMWGRKVELAMGVEHRIERMWDTTYTYAQSSTGQVLLYGANGRSFSKERDVNSIYVEGKIPLLASTSRQQLSVDIGARLEDFSDFGKTTNPIVGVLYQPLEDVLVRATWGTGFVAPSLEQLDYNNFTSPGRVVTDPKRGNLPVTVTDNGNLDRHLDPEDAESISVGLVLMPRFVPGLRLSIDWFSVTKDNNISFQSGQTIVNNEDVLPGLVVRAPVIPGDLYSVGRITDVFFGFLNATHSRIKAIDIGASYTFDTTAGRFSVLGNATVGEQYEIQLAPNGAYVDYLNQPLAWKGAPVRLRGNLGLNWEHGATELGLNVRHIGRYRAAPGYADIQGDSKIDGSNEVGLQLGYDFDAGAARRGGLGGRWLSGTRLTLNVANLFDDDAPFVAGAPTAFGYSELSSARGRSYSLSVRKNFAP